MSEIVKISDLVKYYYVGENVVKAVDHTDLEIERGKFTAIVGRSGSGKSTLLQIMGGLDRPDSGEVIIDGENLFKLKGNQLAVFRRKSKGNAKYPFRRKEAESCHSESLGQLTCNY